MRRLWHQKDAGVVTRLRRWLAHALARRKTSGSGTPLPEILAEELGRSVDWL